MRPWRIYLYLAKNWTFIPSWWHCIAIFVDFMWQPLGDNLYFLLFKNLQTTWNRGFLHYDSFARTPFFHEKIFPSLTSFYSSLLYLQLHYYFPVILLLIGRTIGRWLQCSIRDDIWHLPEKDYYSFFGHL